MILNSKLPLLRTAIPGPRSQELSRTLKAHEAPTVTHITSWGPIFWKRAQDVCVWDVDDNRFLDLTSAFGVASLGHSHPSIVAAIQKQSAELCHAMGDVHPAEGKAALCKKLSEMTFERWTAGKVPGQTLLCNSGFEAVEAALKTAMLFTRKRGVIAFEHAYHGLGYGALEATWRPDFRQPFMEQLGHFVEFVPFPRQCKADPAREKILLDELEVRIREIARQRSIGAILVEPFQGRGGEVIPPAGLLPLLRKICDRQRILLLVDEIYVGLWRTGRAFAVEHSGVVPDVICLGKALTGSLPLAACVGREDVMAAWPQSKGEALHTSTFLGNPLACAAALASLDEFEKHGPSLDVDRKGALLLQRLQSALGKHPNILEIRGIGLMVGIEFKPDAAISPSHLCDDLLAAGIIALPSGSRGEVLALIPPLVMEQQDLDWAADQIIAQLTRAR